MKFTLQNVRLFTQGADLTTRNNKIELDPQVEEKDSTAFVPTGDVWKEVLGGIRSVSLNAGGQWEADDVALGAIDDTAWAGLGAVRPVTVCPATAAVGALAWMTGCLETNYQIGGSPGDVAPWSLQGSSNWPLVRGQVAHDPGTPRIAAGSGTALQLGPVPAGKSLYASLHVLSLAGTSTPSITVTVQSDDTAGFASPSTVLTFDPATGKGGQILRTAPGAIADSYFRASWSVSGSSPSFLFVVALGIA